MIIITPTETSAVTKIVCPHCKEKVARVGLLKESKVDGLTFRCKKCGNLWLLKTE